MSLAIAGSAAFLVLLCVLAGLVYLLKPSCMPYHEKALGRSWGELSDGHRVLHLGLMRMVGAGFLSMALLVSTLTWRSVAFEEPWASLLAGVACTILFATGLYANFSIASKTGAVPPWQGTASGLAAALLLTLSAAAQFSV